MKLRILAAAALLALGMGVAAAPSAEAMPVIRAVPRWVCPPGWHPGEHGWKCYPNRHWHHAWHAGWGWHGHPHWHHGWHHGHGHWHKHWRRHHHW